MISMESANWLIGTAINQPMPLTRSVNYTLGRGVRPSAARAVMSGPMSSKASKRVVSATWPPARARSMNAESVLRIPAVGFV